MTIIEALRKAYIHTIAENPITITVQRTEKIDAGGYFNEVINQHGPYTVRVFQQRSSIPQEVSTLAGTKQVGKKWGLLTDYQADFKAGPNVKDEFSVSGLGYFVVVGIYPQRIQGQIIGYQADLERVS